MEQTSIQKFIPLDKSWINRMGILDIVNGRDDIQKFLAEQSNLGDDLIALKRCAENWSTGGVIDVGESGTLYRLLKFASWKLGLKKEFRTQGTLSHRKVTDDPGIVNLSQAELLKLDNGTSQWATAKVLLGDTERLPNPPYKLARTYEAVDHWQQQRAQNLMWVPKYDETISGQAQAFEKMLQGERPNFVPAQAEDFCFAYIFGYITAEEGEQRWPALRYHESDRIVEVQEMHERTKNGEPVTSHDHRVVQAIAMWAKLNSHEVKFTHPEAVNKSWVQFWDFLKKE